MIEKELPHDHGHITDKLQHEILGTKTFGTISDLFKLMGDEKRIQIFLLLCHCEECVVNISALLDVSVSTATRHIKQLKNAGLIISKKHCKEIYYTATKTPRSEALHLMIEKIIEVACPAEVTFKESKSYDSQIQVIAEICDFLTSDLKTRHSIEELASLFHINQTTLKTTFKKVYGMPIGIYMKKFRIQKAIELLEETNYTVSEIACSLGYENQSKFSQAFKDITGFLPRDYRKNHI